jgi:hypothetical protein
MNEKEQIAAELLAQGKPTEAIEAVNGSDGRVEPSNFQKKLHFSDELNDPSEIKKLLDYQDPDEIKKHRLSDIQNGLSVGPGGYVC